ncbi:MAG: TlpA family protein disulfide reductase [Desulfovibrio sp.]|nr:MAG: TlpA family protein disulfide reductase [Desulfovibrio sp.]
MAVRFLLSVALLMMCSSPLLAAQASESLQADPLPDGEVFPVAELSGDLTAEQRSYLGLIETTESFSLTDIRADVLIVEIYSMYCPFCQKEAPVVQELYDLIQARGLADKVKIIGMAAGNSQAEVEVYRAKFAPPYPLFPDFDYTFHKLCGQVGTPYFYVLERQGEEFFVALQHLGQTESAEGFLRDVLFATEIQ